MLSLSCGFNLALHARLFENLNNTNNTNEYSFVPDILPYLRVWISVLYRHSFKVRESIFCPI